MNKRTSLLIAIILIALTPFITKSGAVYAQQVKVNTSTPGGGQTVTITDPYGGTYSAYLHLPSDYNTSSKTYPLLVFLHGMGEAGTDLSMIYNNGYAGGPAYLAEHNSLPAYTSPTNGQSYEFIVLAPQATSFSTTGANLNKLLKGFVPNYRVDTNRLYITGLSAGGQGITEYMVHSGWTNQYTAAAAIPMSEAWYYPAGSASVIVADGVYNWGFGSDPEDRFGVLTHNLMNEIGAISPGMSRYTNYSGGHCCWNAFYNPAYKENIGGKSMNIYEWLLQFARGSALPLPPTNQAPTANAGADQTITLPTNSLTLSGSGADSDGSISSYAWTKMAGGTVTIGSPSSASTNITSLSQGTYTFRLTVTDNQGATAYDDVVVVVNPAPVPTPTQTQPATYNIDFGSSTAQTATIGWNNVINPATGTLISLVDATGAPTAGRLQITNSFYYNSGNATDSSVNQNGTTSSALFPSSATRDSFFLGSLNGLTDTMAQMTISGLNNTSTYDFRFYASRNAGDGANRTTEYTIGGRTVTLNATDNTNSYIDIAGVTPTNGSVTIGIAKNTASVYGYLGVLQITEHTGSSPQVNVAPTANAGADQTIVLPTNSLTLTGSGTDTDGSISSYAWSQQFGPNTATISSPSAASTNISNLIAGSYRFRLTVTDNSGSTGYDDVNVAVNAAPVANVAPTANAGADQTITLPVSSITLTGSGTDTGGTIASYAWTKTSGGTVTINSPSAASTMVTGLVQGTYTFRLTVMDNSGATATDDMVVTVNAATPTPTPTPSTNTPYKGTPLAIPGTIQAEDFDLGGENVAYYDYTLSNAGYQYRSEDVDIEGAVGGGYDLGWTLRGEWMKYTVNVAADGAYTLQARVASPYGAKTFSIEMDGTKIATVSVPLTGTWQTWAIVNAGTVNLTKGTHVMRIYEDTDGYNIDSLTFAASSTVTPPPPPPTPTATTGQPYGGTAWTIPGTVQAEDFDLGGEGVAYHDADPNNATGVYRPTDGVDLEKASDVGAGYNIGWANHGEWTNYTVNVTAAGTYTIDARFAGLYSGKALRVDVDGVTAVSIPVPNTGGWQNWQTASGKITLPAGIHTIKLYDDIGTTTSWQGFNLNYFLIHL